MVVRNVLLFATSLVAFSVAAEACGFDWSLPAGDAGGGGAGGAGSTQATTGDPGEPSATTATGMTNETCESCAEAAISGECAQQTEACAQTDGCQALSECAFACQADPACVDGCAANTTDEALLAFGALADCVVCLKCGDLCQEYAEVCAQ